MLLLTGNLEREAQFSISPKRSQQERSDDTRAAVFWRMQRRRSIMGGPFSLTYGVGELQRA
jgi:hypothetical protein